MISTLSLKAYGALYGYCFADGESVGSALAYLSNIKSPRDKFFKRESVNCLEVQGSSKTYGLYRRYLSKRFKILRTYKDIDTGAISESSIPKGMCRILVTKIGKRKSKTDTVKLGRRGKLKRSEEKGESRSVSNLVLTYGRRGSIRVDFENVGVTCRKSGSGYQLTFDLESKATALSSSAYVSPGRKLNLGGIVSDLNNKRKTISINSGVEYQKEVGKEKFDYFLEVQ